MAYSDIESWGKQLREQLGEKEVWNEACAKRKAEDEALDAKEMEDLGEDEIDPATLGMTESETDDAEEAVEEEENDVIDFSAYGVEEKDEDGGEKLDEADLREPLTALAAALGKIVSTANLTKQDSAKLNESKAVSEDEDKTPVDAKTQEKAEKAEDRLRAEKDSPIEKSDWAELDEMPEDTKEQIEAKIAFAEGKIKAGGLDFAARRKLFNLVTDWKQALKGVNAEQARKEAFERATELQTLSTRRQLSNDELEEFVSIVKNKLDADQLNDLYVQKPLVHGQIDFTMTGDMASINKGGARQGRQLTRRGDEDNAGDTLADRTGADRVFTVDPEKKGWADRDYEQDPLIPKDGEKATFKTQFDPEFDGNRGVKAAREWEQFLKSATAKDIENYWLTTKDAGEGAKPGDWHGGQMDDEKLADVRKTVAAKAGKSLTPSEWVKALNQMPKEVRDALEGELTADADAEIAAAEDDLAKADAEMGKEFVKKLFNGEVTSLNQKELGIERGFGTGGKNKDKKRSLSTGAITQAKDKITNMLLMLVAGQLDVAQAECRELAQKLRAESTEHREARKRLRPQIMQAIFDAYGIQRQAPNPAADIKSKRQFDALVDLFFKRVWEFADQEEKNEMLEKIFKFHDETLVRKTKTYLNGEQNAKFQELKQRAIEDINNMEDSDIVELVTLNDIRLHNTEPVQARENAIKQVEKVRERHPDNMYALADWLAREYSIGTSGNYNIRARAEQFKDKDAAAPAEQASAEGAAQ